MWGEAGVAAAKQKASRRMKEVGGEETLGEELVAEYSGEGIGGRDNQNVNGRVDGVENVMQRADNDGAPREEKPVRTVADGIESSVNGTNTAPGLYMRAGHSWVGVKNGLPFHGTLLDWILDTSPAELNK